MKMKVNLKEQYRCMCASIGWSLTASIIVSMIALTIKGVRVMFSAEPDWLWLQHTLETQGKDFMRNPHKFKGVVGYYTCKKTGKYKPKTIKPFTHLTPREI